MSNDMKHLGLGNLTAQVGLTKSNLMDVAKLGVGVALFPFLYSFVRGNLLLRLSPQFAQNTMVERVTRALSGVVLGSLGSRLVSKFVGGKWASVGDGMAASAVGSAIMDTIAPMLNPSAAAVQTTTAAAEAATGQEQMSGISPMGRGLAGLSGLGRVAENPALLFGVGTPDMSASSMFNGATVAIDDGRMAGASVAIEQSNFAASLF